MSNPKFLPDTGKFTMTIFIAFIVLFIFCMLMMQWHGSAEKDAAGNTHYNTRVNEPNTNY